MIPSFKNPEGFIYQRGLRILAINGPFEKDWCSRYGARSCGRSSPDSLSFCACEALRRYSGLLARGICPHDKSGTGRLIPAFSFRQSIIKRARPGTGTRRYRALTIGAIKFETSGPPSADMRCDWGIGSIYAHHSHTQSNLLVLLWLTLCASTGGYGSRSPYFSCPNIGPGGPLCLTIMVRSFSSNSNAVPPLKRIESLGYDNSSIELEHGLAAGFFISGCQLRSISALVNCKCFSESTLG